MSAASGDEALTGEADALYALRPDEFTAARNARAKELRPDARALADAVARLPRPSVGAWLANALVRHRGDQLDQLLDLGETLRDAQRDLDAATMRQLGAQRRTLVSAVARDARALGEELGGSVSAAAVTELEGTLGAAMADADAADAVRTGRLVRGLESVGLDAVDLDGAVAGGAGAAAPRPKKSKDDAERERREREDARRRELQEEADRAAAEADAADARVSDLDAAARDAEERFDDLEAERRDLQQRLAQVEQDVTDAARDRRTARRDHDIAVDRATRARRAADRARDRAERD